MPLGGDTGDPRDNIPHGDLLSFFDLVKSNAHPEIGTDESGRQIFPRKQYLIDLAAQKKAALDQQAALASGPPR